MLGWFGIPPQPWIQSTVQAMPSLVLEATWAAAGGSIIIYLAALLAVPPELYDAAEVDGAGIWRKVWHVTLPQLRGILFIMLILQVIATAQVFLEPFLFTGGGPAGATQDDPALHLRQGVPQQPRRRLRRGDRGVGAARDRARHPVVAVLQAHQPLEHPMTTTISQADARRGCADSSRAGVGGGRKRESIDDLAERTIVSAVRATPPRHAIRDVA